ncbi:hypothetical protein OG875_13810 [Streptomyces sp. NBC_01498]|uniref:DUF7848 domain-containing protein n=1 Tax=Streptomyces sp. NBC_01498 TaxID=2975870 RepID=UPI002E7AEF40|nr:hypothetical protein [Streptomyces sp. NBC_01498]WTL25576.1 hypothetical protein OG875_13810 [Streptomyces sp. NBC_01498]
MEDPSPDHPPAEALERLIGELVDYFARSGSDVMRSRHRFFGWTITPNTEPDAPPTLHLFRCTTEDEQGNPCGAESPESEMFEVAQKWPFEHMKEVPEHTGYEQVLRRPWGMVRGDPV